MKVLNLYSGLGGNRKLWQGCEVTAVENDLRISAVYQRLNPDDTVIVGDAHRYLIEHFELLENILWTQHFNNPPRLPGDRNREGGEDMGEQIKTIQWECPVCKGSGTVKGKYPVLDMAMAHDPHSEKECEDHILWQYID